MATVGGLLFTLDLPLLRLAQSERWTLVFARGLLMAGAIVVGWAAVRARRKIPFIAGWAGWGVAATNSLANISYIGAVSETSAANVVFLTALIPVLTAMLSHVLLRERAPRPTLLAAMAAFLGVGLIVREGLVGGHWLGDLLALTSALCTAMAFTIVRASRKNVTTSLAIGSLTSSMIALVLFDASPGALDLTGWAWVSINAIVVIPIASFLLANAPRYLPSTDVSMFFLLETILTPLWMWLLFAEAPADMVWVGGAIVVVALVAHGVWRLRRALDP